MSYQHQDLAKGRWQILTLSEQLGNVGSEISRAIKAKGNEERYRSATDRAFELLDLTLEDARWKGRLKEIVRARELLGDALHGGVQFYTTLEDLDTYFFHFAVAARLSK